MTTTFRGEGKFQEFTAPSGGVTSGTPVLIGALLVIPQTTAAVGIKFSGQTMGVHQATKLAGNAWVEGQRLFWDNTNARFTGVSASGLFPAGVAAAAAASADVAGEVRLDGISLVAVA